MENLSLLLYLLSLLILFQVDGNHTWLHKHPGFDVLAQASHYWPLGTVEGIHELRDTNGALRVHNFTVLPSHNSTFVYTNDSAYSNFSATVDIVEGMVNKGICIPDPTGVMFLLFGSYQNSCIINPELCEPEGGEASIVVVLTGITAHGEIVTHRVTSLQVGPGDLLLLQLISRLQRSVPLEEMAVLMGVVYGIIPCSAIPRLYPQISRNFLTWSWQP